MRRWVWIVLVILALLALLALAYCHFKEGPSEQKKIALPLPKGTPNRPQGTPALTVKTGAVQPFAKEDVATYFQTHNLPMNMGARGDIQVESIEYLTNKEVTERLSGASPGLADNDRVGFTVLAGTFIFSGPPGSKLAKFSRAYAVFSAQTGNLLMVGTLDQARGDQPR